MKRSIWLLAALVGLALSGTLARADVKLPKVFSDNLVLQQKSAAPIWGTAEAGEKVTVTLGDAKGEATADSAGKWLVKIETPAADKTPRELKVSGKNEIVLRNILIGEVWVCSGQSNMQWSVAASANPKEETESANYPLIRLYTVPSNGALPSAEPQDDFTLERKDNSNDLKWVECTPKNIPNFSAVAYFFGRRLQKDLDIPIGLINTSWGGTICEAWTSKPALESNPDSFGPILERSSTFRPGNPNQASVLYNGMIKPLVPYAIRGAIWYQGESNVGRAEQYAKLFPAMIADWRKSWNQGDFPFLFVQLAPYCYNGDARTRMPKDSGQLAELWEAQLKTLNVPSTGMAVTTDITDLFDIHPKNKQDVGARLALWALANTYGKKDLAYSGPLYDSMQVDGNKIRIKFKHAQGLKAKDGDALTSFQIAGEDQKFVDAKATVQGDSVIVEGDVAKPVAVRFGWKDFATPNLVNAADLPASPFRTDDWKMVTAGRK